MCTVRPCCDLHGRVSWVHRTALVGCGGKVQDRRHAIRAYIVNSAAQLRNSILSASGETGQAGTCTNMMRDSTDEFLAIGMKEQDTFQIGIGLKTVSGVSCARLHTTVLHA